MLCLLTFRTNSCTGTLPILPAMSCPSCQCRHSPSSMAASMPATNLPCRSLWSYPPVGCHLLACRSSWFYPPVGCHLIAMQSLWSYPQVGCHNKLAMQSSGSYPPVGCHLLAMQSSWSYPPVGYHNKLTMCYAGVILRDNVMFRCFVILLIDTPWKDWCQYLVTLLQLSFSSATPFHLFYC